METTKHKTLKRPAIAQEGGEAAAGGAGAGAGAAEHDPFRNLLDESARDAFRRPWHRLERGLRLNRLRMYIEEMSAQCSFTAAEKEAFFKFLAGALDRRLLNTHKIVDYVPELQKIKTIQGLEVRRVSDGTCKWGFVRKVKADGTRKARKVIADATATAATATGTAAGTATTAATATTTAT